MRSELHVAFDGRSLTAPVLRGWDRYTVGLIGGLIDRGVNVTLLHRSGDPPRPEHLSGLTVRCREVAAHRGLVWEQKALPLVLHRDGYDLYHAPAEHGIPWLAPCPTLLTVHSVLSYSYRALVAAHDLTGTLVDYLGYEWSPRDVAAWYWRSQISRASRLLVPSDYCRREVIRHLNIGSGRVHTTPLALPAQFCAPPQSADARRAVLSRLGVRPPYLLYVGGFEHHKNPQGLIRAFGAVKRQRPDLTLVLVGSQAVPPTLLHLAWQLGVSVDLTCLVNITEDLRELYDGAELFVSLSWIETFCLPALEALSRGLLPVTTAWGALPEVVGDAGWLVDPRDPEAAAATIVSALSAPDLPQRRARGLRRVESFTWDETARTTLKVYEDLLR